MRSRQALAAVFGRYVDAGPAGNEQAALKCPKGGDRLLALTTTLPSGMPLRSLEIGFNPLPGGRAVVVEVDFLHS